MKILKYSFFCLALAAGLSGCQNDYDAPTLQDPKATLVPNTTLAEFKDIFKDEAATEVGTKDNGDHYIIHGRVISSDASGNIYKSLVIQDETSALAFSINRSNMNGTYRIGQEIVVDATGLHMGLYNGLQQLGSMGEYNGSPAITFMPYTIFEEHTQLNGLPNQNMQYVTYGVDPVPTNGDPYCYVMSIDKIPTAAGTEDFRNIQSQLIEIPNVSFDGGGESTFAPYQQSVNQYIRDAQGNSLVVRTSGYSNFYNDVLPVGTGTVRGILSYYGDAWQLLLRDIRDVMFGTEGSKSEPYTVDKAIAQNNNGRTLWTEGYIVGSIKAGVSTVTGNADIEFGADADLDNNLVIAPTADCKDWTQCMAVELPAASMFRKYANLADNQGVYGKKLTVIGTYRSWMGMHGIVGCPGSFADFEVEGLEIEGITGQGSGTATSPYTVTFIQNTTEEMTDVYVEGYIVGYVSGRDYTTGAKFNDQAPDDRNYNGANIIIANAPDVTDPTMAIPVNGIDRNAYGLKKNPQNYKKKVVIQGNVGMTQFGTRGITSVASCTIVE